MGQEPVTVTMRNYRKNGDLFYNELTIKPLADLQGDVIYLAVIRNDVTEDVELELENLALAKKLTEDLKERAAA